MQNWGERTVTARAPGRRGRSDSEEDTGFPGWLQPVADAADDITVGQLTRLRPPAHAMPRAASVLILFGDSSGGPDVLLLERAHDMRRHAGQVAFPGGAQDPEDADAVAAALREAQEETGLDPAGVDVFGVLPSLWLPPTNYAVTPVLAWWRAPSAVFVVDPAETASVHTVPIAELLDPGNRMTVRHPSGFLGPAFRVSDLVVWGFTAGVLSRLFAIVGWEVPWDDARVIDLPEALVSSSLRDVQSALDAGTLAPGAYPWADPPAPTAPGASDARPPRTEERP
jgi:8-oxo-dGTP pyrophosphatase MutT (NUDIX family)